MGETGTEPGRGGPLDLLRFLAAAIVVLYHYAEDAPVPLDRLSPLFSDGWVATDFFLMLSGYVLALAYGSRVAGGGMGSAPFLAKRLVRIWPAHAIMLAMLAAMVLGARLTQVSAGLSHGYDWAWLPADLFLVQAWGLGVPGGWNLPTWSLSALVVCYAVFPTLWRGLARLRPLHALAAGLAAVIAAQLVAAAAGLRLADLPLQMGALRAVPLFFLGCALARFGTVREAAPDRVNRLALAALAAGGVLAAALEPTLGALLAIAGVIALLGPMRPRTPWPWAAWAASLSFPLFITHFGSGELWFHTARALLPNLADQPLLGWGVWAGGVAFALVFAAGFDRFVDRPLQALIKRQIERFDRRRALASAPA